VDLSFLGFLPKQLKSGACNVEVLCKSC